MKITLESFLAVLSKSGLVPPDKLPAMHAAFLAQHTGAAEGQPFAEYLIAQNTITPWQAEKLLQGKHKGFFLGKYRLLALLGKGGMSSVYLAEHVLMRRRCAIKVLPAKRVNDTSYLGRFHREAQAVAALDHPNIVRAYDVDHEVDGNVEIHFLVMEYVDGLSLLDIVNRDGPMHPAAAAEYIRQSAMGLEHAHRAGLIHRDVKPGNLLVDAAGIVKVMDLGLARFFTNEDSEQESLTIQYDEKVLGTADYLAPEQAVDSHAIDARADIYSLGCTLYFLLVGHPPFNQGTLPQRLMAHQTKEPPPVEAERKDVPKSLLDILRKMMSKKAEDRYATAAGVSEACLEWLQANGGERWTSMRAKLAESGIDIGGSSGRIGSGSTRVSPEKAAQLTQAAKGGSKTPVPQPAAAVSPVIDTSAPTAPAVPAGKSAKPAKASAPAGPKPKPAPQPVAADDELGSFLANLGGTEKPPAPRAPAPEPVTITTAPAKSDRPKPAPAKPAPVAKPAPAARPPAPKPVAAPVAAPVTEAVLVEPVEAEVVADDEPAEALVAEAPAAASGSATSLPKKPARPGIPKQYLIYGGAAGGLVLAVVLAIVMFSGGDAGSGEGNAAPTGGSVAGTTGGAASGTGGTPNSTATSLTGAGTPAPPPPKARPVPDSPTEVKVGPDGHFATISEALAYAVDNPPLTDPSEPRVIKVAGGQTYAERLSIQNWNLGVLHIQVEGDQPATLKPEGTGPVVRLENCNKVTLEGLQLDAAGKPTAMELVGTQSHVRLLRLKVTGFSQFGISGDRAAGFRSGRLELRDSTLQTAQAAAGIRLTAPVDAGFAGGVQYVTLANCSLLGSYGVGIEITGAQSQNIIQRNRIHNVKTGLKLGLTGVDLDALVIENNTFHHVAQGIVIDQPPKAAKGVAIQKNLFADAAGPEISFEAAGDAALGDAFKAAAVLVFNATERAADTVQTNALDLFANNGQTGLAADFQSTDPAAGDFLKPKNAALKAPGAPGGDKFIGAVPP
jgi:serine/threonine-protein kinase